MPPKSLQIDISKMEKQVKSNSNLLDKEFNSLIKTNNGKYVVFHKGQHFIVNSLANGLTTGIEKFGIETGFVLKKLSKSTPIFSLLVKL